jgi:hypothetical protein
MKKSILFLLAIVAFLCYSCSFSFSSNPKDLQEQINQLQQEVAVLQKMNGLTPSYEIKNDTVVSSIPANTKAKDSDGEQTAPAEKSRKEQPAINAIEYCLKMYEPDLKYTAIRSVPKSDGTVDVIIDYTYMGSVEHTYYNVTVYSNKEFKVNHCRGFKGLFPHGSKFKIQ